MKIVCELGPKDLDRWDSFVKRHPFGRIYHLSCWRNVIERSFTHIKGHFLALHDTSGNQIIAGLPIYSVRSWLTGNRLVSIPFGTLSDPLVSSTEEMETLLAGAVEILGKTLSYIEIRTTKGGPLLERIPSYAPSFFYKHHYLGLDADLSDLRRRFHRSSINRKITKATKSGFTVKLAENETDLMRFYEIFGRTRSRLSLPTIPYVFFKSLWTTLHPLGLVTILLVIYENRTVGANLLLGYKDLAAVEYSADDERLRHLGLNQLLWWESIRLAYNKGYKIFSFGRTSRTNQGLMTYKSRWGTEIEELPHFFHPRSAARKEEIRKSSLPVKIICKMAHKATHPVLMRLMSSLVYRHMG